MREGMDQENNLCLLCQKKCFSVRSLQLHIQTHFVKYTCDDCNKHFAIKDLLKIHMARHRKGNFKCPHCQLAFETFGKYDDHRKTHLGGLYICHVCKERFKTFYSREKHMNVEHNQLPKFGCKGCNLSFLQSVELKFHNMRMHSAVQIKKHACHLCEWKFLTAHDLKGHLLVHTGEKNLNCNDCNKAFSRKRNLIQHMKIHGSIKNNLCTICGMAFVQKCSLDTHMRKHEKEPAFQPPKPNYFYQPVDVDPPAPSEVSMDSLFQLF